MNSDGRSITELLFDRIIFILHDRHVVCGNSVLRSNHCWLSPSLFIRLSVNMSKTSRLHRIGSILFDWFDLFENRTHSKIDVRFCSIAEPNRTPIVRLSSIGFLFDFVRLDTPGIYINQVQVN